MDKIELTRDELMAVIDELSFRPYRDVFQLIPALVMRVKEAEDHVRVQEPQIITDPRD